jgi:hypothetical protein
MSLTDEFCKSRDLRDEERTLCVEVASNFYDMMKDMDEKGYLRSELGSEKGEEERIRSTNVLWNVRKVTKAFNMFFDMYADRVKSNTKHRLDKFLELNKPYGLTEEDLRYLLISEMVFVFLQNIEEFRFALLFIMKLPIHYSDKGKQKTINKKTTLGTLLKSLEGLGIRKINTLKDIDYDLRNGLSHCLFWFDEKGDLECPKPHLHYSEDITFKHVKWLSIADLYSKTRNQSIYTNCLLNVIGDWFW